MSSKQWNALFRELDQWGEHNRIASLWCRDDDAFEYSPSLERLASMSADAGVPVGLAVIPQLATPALAEWLNGREHLQVLVHGYAHVNHAPAEHKRAEFGAHRPLPKMLNEAQAGWRRIRCLFDTQAVPVFVPPWNRVCTAVIEELTSAGLKGISTFRPRTRLMAAHGLRQTNCHVDIVDWKGGRGFVGEGRAIERLVGHLAARRLQMIDHRETIGVLSHHKDNDAGCWAFLERLWEVTIAHSAARWLSTSDAVWPA